MYVVHDKTKMYCPKCGNVLNAEDADEIYHPATWGWNGGSPPEYEWKCPECGEELEVVECFCDVCGEPVVHKYDDNYYESSGNICDECMEIIKQNLEIAIADTANELGVDWNEAIDAMIDYAEGKDWLRKEVKDEQR